MSAYLPARDPARARRFYETKLGFKAAEEHNGGVVYRFAGGTACFLHPTPNAGTSKASQAFWSVTDVDGVITALKSRGVEFEDYPDIPGERSAAGAVTAGGAKAASFKDSEGNMLAPIKEAPAHGDRGVRVGPAAGQRDGRGIVRTQSDSHCASTRVRLRWRAPTPKRLVPCPPVANAHGVALRLRHVPAECAAGRNKQHVDQGCGR